MTLPFGVPGNSFDIQKTAQYPFVSGIATPDGLVGSTVARVIAADSNSWQLQRDGNPVVQYSRNMIAGTVPFLSFVRPAAAVLICFCTIDVVSSVNAQDARPAVSSQSDRDTALRKEAAELLAQNDPAQQIRLIMIDLELSTDSNAESQKVCRDILKTLALSGSETALAHVRSVFENDPERRAMAAWALSQSTAIHPTDLQDWRFMVRSLDVVTGDDAASVMTSLQRFRPRANKAHWVRRVILIGIRLPEAEQQHAAALLRHWTGTPRGKASWTLAQYQEWFRKEFPESPDPSWPVDQAGAVWTHDRLAGIVHSVHSSPELTKSGAAVFEKAGCNKCHKRGATGSLAGPDLTTLGWRKQKEEILMDLLYPSHDLHEEYPTVTVALKDGKVFSGLLQPGADGALAVVNSKAERQEFPRADVESMTPQRVSNMPAGTLEPLSETEIQQLFSFLTSVEGIPKPHAEPAGDTEE